MPDSDRANARGHPVHGRRRRRLRLLLAVGATTLGLLALGAGGATAHNWDGWHWHRGGSQVNINFWLDGSAGNCASGFPATNAMYDIWNNPHPVYNWCVNWHSDVHVFEAYNTASWCGYATVWNSFDWWNNHISHGHAQFNTRCSSGAGYSGNAFKQGIHCQEIGHVLGQEHSATGDCMNFGYFWWDTPYRNWWGNTGLYVWDWDHNSADLYYRYISH
jgi:hypothetical protein